MTENPGNSTFSVVVVDDDPVIQLSTTRLLRKEGYTVAEASSGAEGEALIRKIRPDLVLLDVNLGDADGRDLCKSLRNEPELKNTFLVLVSNSSKTTDDQVRGLNEGADGYIVRPIENRELVARVKAYLRIAAAEHKLRETIDALQKSEVRYQKLAQHLEAVLENEYVFLANELHDDLGQMFTVIKIDLAEIEKDAICPPGTKARIQKLQNLLSEGVLGVHSLCRRLRPGALDDMGLEESLIGLVDDWQQCNKVTCDFCADIDEETLSDGIRTAVFRLVQEALTNVSRYAKASKVEIRLVSDKQTVRVSVADNGCGMEADAKNKPASFGLLGMRERVEALGGELHIETALGAGVRIEGTIPLNRKGPDLPSLSRPT